MTPASSVEVVQAALQVDVELGRAIPVAHGLVNINVDPAYGINRLAYPGQVGHDVVVDVHAKGFLNGGLGQIDTAEGKSGIQLGATVGQVYLAVARQRYDVDFVTARIQTTSIMVSVRTPSK
ncbi:MAG: hypothetical protein R2857_10520 [Vampirovibrionales bacterium]